MKLTQLTATAAFAATLVKGWDTRYPLTASRCKFMDTFNPETIVRFFRSQEPECHSYDESGGHWLEHGKIQKLSLNKFVHKLGDGWADALA